MLCRVKLRENMNGKDRYVMPNPSSESQEAEQKKGIDDVTGFLKREKILRDPFFVCAAGPLVPKPCTIPSLWFDSHPLTDANGDNNR
jgi:hypothetical protein